MGTRRKWRPSTSLSLWTRKVHDPFFSESWSIRETWCRLCTEARSKCTMNTSLSLKTRKLDNKFFSRSRCFMETWCIVFIPQWIESEHVFRKRRSNEPGNRFDSSVHSVLRVAQDDQVKFSFLPSTHDSAESIATPPESDFDDEQLRALLASPLYLQERGASERESLMSSSSQDPRSVTGKVVALFSSKKKGWIKKRCLI